jgi:glucose/arabinose dehydrogenase
VAALRGRALHRLENDGDRAEEAEILLDGTHGRLRAVVEAPDGSFWVTTSNLDDYGERVSRGDDRILRVVPPRG